MNFLNLLHINGVELYTQNKIVDTLKKEFVVEIDKETFQFQVLIFPHGTVEFNVETSIHSFSRKFSIDYKNYNSGDKIDTYFDFSLSIDENKNLAQMVTIAKFNLYMAEMFKELLDDKEFRETLKKRFDYFELETIKEYEKEKKYAEEKLAESKALFESEHTILDSKEVSKKLKMLKKDSLEGAERISHIFHVVDHMFGKQYFRVSFLENSYYMSLSHDLASLENEDHRFRYGNKALLKEVKRKLERTYKM